MVKNDLQLDSPMNFLSTLLLIQILSYIGLVITCNLKLACFAATFFQT